MTTDLEHSPESKLMRVRSFTGPTAQFDAGLARNILETQGIPCLVRGGVMGEVLPGIDVVHLMVREEDAEQTAEILQAYLDSPGLAPSE